MAQEGLRLLESIVNNQSSITKPSQYELHNATTVQGSTGESKSEEVYKNSFSPEERELGDAYALLARVYAGPRFRGPSLDSQRIICAPINVFTIAFAVIVQSVHYRRYA